MMMLYSTQEIDVKENKWYECLNESLYNNFWTEQPWTMIWRGTNIKRITYENLVPT